MKNMKKYFVFCMKKYEKYFVLNDTMSFISVSNLINESHVCKKNYQLTHAFHLLMD